MFQNQLEKLQDGDRLYYLARTPGMNLRTQLEGNSFSELIQRNTDGTNSLKADAFATADCKFQLANLDRHRRPAIAALGLGSSPTTRPRPTATRTCCCCASRTARSSTGRCNTVDPSGINGQSVYNGTAGVDRIFGGNDNDTFWGGAGNDVIEGNGGDDIALGGDGNDIITDLDGADVLKGGPGNDAIDAGPGDDIIMGGDGQDFINGGANDNETFAGPGNDFVIAGQGADAVFGDGGDDWIEGGTGQDLLQGDHGAPFFDDPARDRARQRHLHRPGRRERLRRRGWRRRHGAERGHRPQRRRRRVRLGDPPVRHRRRRRRHGDQQQPGRPADPGRRQPRPLAGDRGRLRLGVQRRHPGHRASRPATVGGAGFTGCDVLDQAGVDRIAGLGADRCRAAHRPTRHRSVADLAPSGVCPVTGPVWGEGDILLGGAGSDTIDGPRRRRHHRRRPRT